MEEKKQEQENNSKDNPTEEKTEKQEERKTQDYSKQTKIVVVVMIIFLVSVFLVYWISQEQKKFTLDGVEFYKQKEGAVTYHNSLLGYVTSTGEQIPFILKLRTDPKELGKIPVTGKIQIMDQAIVSLSPEVVNCSETYITLFDLSLTLKAFGTNLTVGSPDLEYARENNFTPADCKNSMEKTVILIREGNQTQISQEEVFFKNCYIIDLKDCQIREGYERFILRYITDSLMN